MKTSRKSKIVVKGFVLCAAIALLGVIPSGQAQVVNQAVQTSAITVNEQQLETGPVLDVIPYVLSDGYTVNLTLIPSLTEFDGYDQQATPNIANLNSLNLVVVPNLLPKFTVRQVVTTVNIWDNQTVVLGGLISSSVQEEKDKVPVLGDLPLVGRLFQSQSKVSVKKNLMIFVTATIVDPAGNRVHSDDELPFLQSTIPPQQPGVEVRPGNAGATPVPVR
jgi:type II secretory pathway component GspD/PulD (secretin)